MWCLAHNRRNIESAMEFLWLQRFVVQYTIYMNTITQQKYSNRKTVARYKVARVQEFFISKIMNIIKFSIIFVIKANEKERVLVIKRRRLANISNVRCLTLVTLFIANFRNILKYSIQFLGPFFHTIHTQKNWYNVQQCSEMKGNNKMWNYFWRSLKCCHSLSNWLQKRRLVDCVKHRRYICTMTIYYSAYQKSVKWLFLNVNCMKILDIEYFSHIKDSHSDKLQCFSYFIPFSWFDVKKKQQQTRVWNSMFSAVEKSTNENILYEITDTWLFQSKCQILILWCNSAFIKISSFSHLEIRHSHKANTQWLNRWMESK